MRIYMGAGLEAPQYAAEGWRCCDTQSFPGVDMVASCWALPVPDVSVDEILAKGLVEHLTYHEVERTLIEWRRVLKPGAFITLDVPDVDEYIRQYVAMRAEQASGATHAEGRDGGADGEPGDLTACTGIDRWLRRALWGWQRWPGDEHRSGWTEPLLRFYLTRTFDRVEIRRMAVSFDEDVPISRTRHLWARVWR